MNKTQILIALVIVSLVGICGVYIDLTNLLETKAQAATPIEKKVKHGEQRQYTKDKKLKTIVNYDQGIKHGISYLYHKDGKTVLLAMPYENGKRQGVSQKYFENGKLYASTSYENDLLHGPRKLFYSSGQIKAQINYGYGFPGLGTREYLTDGQLKKELFIVLKKNGSTIWLDTSEPCEKSKFYIGELIEDTFLDPMNKKVELLMDDNGKFYVDTEVYTPSYLKYQDIICSCESSQGNPLILKTRI